MLKVPQPPGINVELCELELPTKITRFFEGLRQQVWIASLKLGVQGRSWNHCVETLDDCFFRTR